jgi:hypothetical protein
MIRLLPGQPIPPGPCSRMERGHPMSSESRHKGVYPFWHEADVGGDDLQDVAEQFHDGRVEYGCTRNTEGYF